MKAVDLNEYQAISASLQHYLDGARMKSADEMRKAFHEQATIFGYFGPDLLAGPIELLFGWHEENGPAKDIVAHITILDVTETVAMVRFEADNWTGHRFTDYLTMLKVDGAWKIMNKVFHHHTT